MTIVVGETGCGKTTQVQPSHPEPYTLEGYLVHKKLLPPRTLQYDYALGPMVVGETGCGKKTQARPLHPIPYTLNTKS